MLDVFAKKRGSLLILSFNGVPNFFGGGPFFLGGGGPFKTYIYK